MFSYVCSYCGAGMMGLGLAQPLLKLGHTVAIIDPIHLAICSKMAAQGSLLR